MTTSFCHPVNHSCEPNVVLDLSSKDMSRWNMRALRQIKPGDPCESQDAVSSSGFDYRRNDDSDVLLPEHRVENGSAIRLPLRLEGTPEVILLPRPVADPHKRGTQQNCLGRIEGALNLTATELSSRGFINPWIWAQFEAKSDGSVVE